ncbi:amidohydrolase [Algimonas arctica]|nr:amidohydrolase family protein [Algimonas arctica]
MKKLMCAAVILASCNAASPDATPELSGVTLYQTTAITADPNQPVATGVAVLNGGITAVGDFDALKDQLRGAVIDTQYADQVLLPGLIDPHVHMTLGAMMYGAEMVPPWDVPMADGVVKGLTSREALLARITEIEAAAPDGPLVLWGYHDLIQGDIRRADLDAITTDRPLLLWHWSGHDFYLNSAAIEMVGATPALADQFHGIELDADGELTGRIYEDALLAIFEKIAAVIMHPTHIKRGWDRYEALLQDAGVTTVAEMGYGIFGRNIEDAFLAAHHDDTDGYTIYLVPEHRAFLQEFGETTVEAMTTMAATRDDVLPQVKLFSDAAFYSQTMKLTAPGYIGGQSKGTTGLFVIQPDDLPDLMASYWDAGLDIHIHSNGDAAQDSTLAALEQQSPGKEGQRLIVEHAALLTPEQIARLAKLPAGVSAASHYVRYMGGTMADAIGAKADYLSPMGSTASLGIPTTLHSDAPLAPPYPLLAAQAHMLRDTETGTVSLPNERLNAEQALRAITLDAAWSLGLETEIGSIEAGKRADFTIVDRNPLSTAADDWDDIQVLGRIKDGVVYP